MLVLLSSVPLFMIVPTRTSCRTDDQSEFEINLRAPEGTSLEATEVITNRVASGGAAAGARKSTTRWSPSAATRRSTRNLASIYVRLQPIEASAARSVRHHERRPHGRPAAAGDGGCARRCSRWQPLAAAARRTPTIQFLINGPDLRTLDVIGNQLLEKIKTLAGVVDLDTLAERRQAGAVGAGRSAEGVGPGRADR